jgi:hypothetical protein
MHWLASLSWPKVVMVAFGWMVLFLVTTAIAMSVSLRQLRAAADPQSGGLAAVGFGLAPSGWLLLLGPPLVIILLRLYAGRSHRQSAA